MEQKQSEEIKRTRWVEGQNRDKIDKIDKLKKSENLKKKSSELSRLVSSHWMVSIK